MPLLDKIKSLNDKKPLKERYAKQNVVINAPVLNNQDRNELENESDNYLKFIRLKELVRDRIKGSFNNKKLNFWIIQEWGGIRTFKKNNTNQTKIESFGRDLPTLPLSDTYFNTISSLSKIASFIDPSKYAIYDSRAIYSLNWLILTTEPQGLKFFPIPSGRNKKMQELDLTTIIHLKNLEPNQQINPNLFYSKNDAYHKYCELLNNLSQEVYGENNKPYLIEMLLFKCFDSEIHEEVRTRCQLQIND